MPPDAPNDRPTLTEQSQLRIGLFGGSFDPVHVGHVALAEACRREANLDEVWFVPTAIQPHKPGGPLASDQQRVEMIRLAIAGHAGLACSLVEIDRGGRSYTAETLEDLATENPNHRYWLLMGADTLRDLPNWRRPVAVLRLATPLVVNRPGGPAPDFSVLAPVAPAERIALLNRTGFVNMPEQQVSSSGIRQKVRSGESIAGLVPPAVEAYIHEHRLYA